MPFACVVTPMAAPTLPDAPQALLSALAATHACAAPCLPALLRPGDGETLMETTSRAVGIVRAREEEVARRQG